MGDDGRLGCLPARGFSRGRSGNCAGLTEQGSSVGGVVASPNGVAEAWFGPMGAHSLPATPVQDWRARLPNRPVRHLLSRHVRVIDPAAGGIR